MKNSNNPGRGHRDKWEARIPGNRTRTYKVPGATKSAGPLGSAPSLIWLESRVCGWGELWQGEGKVGERKS